MPNDLSPVCSSFDIAAQLNRSMERFTQPLIETLQQLIRIPSENIPPRGGEHACQLQIAEWLRELDIKPDIYDITAVDKLKDHPEFYPGRSYAARPNLNCVVKGSGTGRSLILSGHIDTVPADTPVEWRRTPFGGEFLDGRIFGRGAWDMKAGVAAHLTVLRILRECRIKLSGDLIFETVVDEEFGGANGTLAARLRGYGADAAVIGEPTSLKICPAQRGGRTLHILLKGDGGILTEDRPAGRVIDQLAYILSRLSDFRKKRQTRLTVDPYYANSQDPFAVWVTNIATGKWGWTQPISIPERCRIELYWQTMPHETEPDVERDFHQWWNETLLARPDLFYHQPVVESPMRWLPGSSIPPESPLVTEFAATVETHGLHPIIEGLDAPSDMYIFQKCFGIPAIMWGAKGAGAHQADEYVEIDSLVIATRLLAHFVCRWCGVESIVI